MIWKRWIISLLKRSDQRMGLDSAYFLKGSFFGFFQQGIGFIAGFGTSYIFGHYISKTTFGEYNLTLSILSILTLISLPGIDTPLVQSIAQGQEGSFIKAIKARFYSSLIGVPALLLFAWYYIQNNQPVVASLLLISLLFFPFLYSLQSFQSFFVAKKRFGVVSFFSIFSSLAHVIFLLIAVIIARSSPGLIIAYLLAMIIPSVIGTWYAKTKIKSARADKKLIPYGFFLTFNNSLSWVTGHLGSIILGTLLGVEEVARFAVATKLPQALQKSYATLSKPITAKIASYRQESHDEILFKHGWKLLLLGIGLFASLWVVTPPVIRFLFPEYRQALVYAQWLSLIFIPMPLTWALSDILIFQRNRLSQVVINTVPNIVKLLAYFIVIPIWKTPGLVAITIVDDYFILLVYLVMFYYIRSAQKKRVPHL